MDPFASISSLWGNAALLHYVSSIMLMGESARRCFDTPHEDPDSSSLHRPREDAEARALPPLPLASVEEHPVDHMTSSRSSSGTNEKNWAPIPHSLQPPLSLPCGASPPLPLSLEMAVILIHYLSSAKDAIDYCCTQVLRPLMEFLLIAPLSRHPCQQTIPITTEGMRQKKKKKKLPVVLALPPPLLPSLEAGRSCVLH